MEVIKDDYQVRYESETATLNFKGLLRESKIADYQPIQQLLDDVTALEPSTITMNLHQLEFLNSSGMTILSRFVIGLRKKKTIQLVVRGSDKIPWQKKSLGNWQRLMPSLTLDLE
ncbi:MAG: hypothetical protein J7641_08580 [Cyanobacteria bacterium SID2]|nr:hypothetical protein [Cyanobacteria bacterium SID2]MBP0006573.1 hypothetical protein [Cyanobacteria bacterium SBC]